MSCTPAPWSARALAPALALLILAADGSAFGQSTAPAVDAATLARYDKNHNGVLDADERAALEADQAKAAQAVKTSKPAEAGADDDVVQMSPFQVTQDTDRGYSASSTMSGTRIKSPLEDVAGSVTVVTKQQLIDTAAVDINDIFQYEVGTEGTKQYTDLTNDGRGDYDNVAGNPTGANRVRGLSAAQMMVGGFAQSSSIPVDTYNVSAVEIVRGPNSNLAGLSDAGGSVNLVQSKAQVNRESTSVNVRADSYGGFRTSLDANRPLVKGKAALRFSAMYEEKGFVRRPALDATNRQQLALTLTPFRKTIINASFERYSEFARRANSLMPRENITNWRANGSPTWNVLTRSFTVNGVTQAPLPITGTNSNNLTANLIPGIALLGSSNVRMAEYIDNGAIQYLEKPGNPSNDAKTYFQLTQSASPTETRPLWKIPSTTDKSIYDYTSVNLAAPNFELNQAKIFNVSLNQNLVQTARQQLDLEVAYRREDQQNYRRMFVAQQDGVGNLIVVDTNEYLLDGNKNPWFLHPYMGGLSPQVYRRPSFTEQARAQLAYQLDFRRSKGIARWLGFYRLLGYQEYRMSITSPSSLRYHDEVAEGSRFLGPIPRTNQTNATGLVLYPRFYLGGANAGVQYANPGPAHWTGAFTAMAPLANGTGAANWTTDQVTIDEVYFAIGTQKKKIRTSGLSLQSYLVDDRIIPTFGYRRDRVYTIDNFGLAPDETGFIHDFSNFNNFGVNKKWRAGNTETKGVVVKPFLHFQRLDRLANDGRGLASVMANFLRGLEFHYNQSNSFQPADTAYNLYLQELPNPQGETKEYGVGWHFGNQLSIRVTHYDTIQYHTRASTGTIASRTLGMDVKNPGTRLTFALYDLYLAKYQLDHPEWTPEQQQKAVTDKIGLDPDFINTVVSGGKTISDANDAESIGTDVEVQFNPTRYWTLKLAGGRQIATDSNISLFIQKYINERLPIWTTIADPNNPDVLWWSTHNGSNDRPDLYYQGTIQAPLDLAITTQGKRKPQTREYRANLLTKYNLAGLFPRNNVLQGISVGGAVRWASKGAIGYYAGAADADGVIRHLDPNRPIWDKPQANIDAWITYRTKLFRNRIGATFQLNVANLTENGHRLLGVAANPDGQYWNYRIIDPRQFILQATFDF